MMFKTQEEQWALFERGFMTAKRQRVLDAAVRRVVCPFPVFAKHLNPIILAHAWAPKIRAEFHRLMQRDKILAEERREFSQMERENFETHYSYLGEHSE